MNLINKILLGCLLLVGLVGCGAGEVPPSPDAPGGVAGEYSVALDELGSWANEAVTLSVSPDILTEGIEQDQTIEIEDTFIWSTFYVYHFKTGEWAEGVYEDPTYKNTGWIQNYAHIFYDDNIYGEDSVGDYIVATYSCTKTNSGWDCHGGWQVEGFSVTKNSIQNASLTASGRGTVESFESTFIPNYEYPGYEHYIVIHSPHADYTNFGYRGSPENGTFTNKLFTEKLGGLDFTVISINKNNWDYYEEFGFSVIGNFSEEKSGEVFSAYLISLDQSPSDMNDIINNATTGYQSAEFNVIADVKYNLPDMPGAIGLDSECTDGVDNDADGLIDSEDPSCLYGSHYE